MPRQLRRNPLGRTQQALIVLQQHRQHILLQPLEVVHVEQLAEPEQGVELQTPTVLILQERLIRRYILQQMLELVVPPMMARNLPMMAEQELRRARKRRSEERLPRYTRQRWGWMPRALQLEQAQKQLVEWILRLARPGLQQALMRALFQLQKRHHKMLQLVVLALVESLTLQLAQAALPEPFQQAMLERVPEPMLLRA